MHLVLTGATGLVGSAVLDAMIKTKDITRISILSRRPVKMAEDAKDPRINVIIHKDFEKYDSELISKLKGASGVVWALGISQALVTKEEYVKITKDYALAAAEAFQKIPNDSSEPFRFVFVSGKGTTHNPGRFTSTFAHVKGETELLLAGMRKSNPLFQADSVRPAFIDSKTHEAIKPYIPKLSPAFNAFLFTTGPVMRNFNSIWSPTEQLGQFLTQMAMGKFDSKLTGPGIDKVGNFSVIENSAIHRLMESP
ncbi:hypothetical protein jhhlp_008829 [Lomentospora prolificans]|uniref:NAD(P)-binding domain-containing protein n=1 Tax=Lomentospora prolificans TaxID=41688 RepID=A0A2N3MZ48_9PEZI|nr:hypothetical protein jhhlp_008829 [Lomentospora prolificans]